MLGFYQRKVASRFIRRPFGINLKKPVISFTFDDFPRSALLTGGAILNQFGVAGTYYASFGLAGQETASGKIFVIDDLTALLEQGHELGCHTYSHCDSWQTPPQVFEKEINANRDALHSFFPRARFQTFSYPISLPRLSTKSKIAPYFFCCRGGGQKTNVGTADLNLLSAYFLEKARGDLDLIKKLIDENSEARGWLVFATHDISREPTQFGCTPEFFESVVRYAVASGAQILPVVEGLELLGVPGIRTSLDPDFRRSFWRPRVSDTRPKQDALVSILIPAYNAELWIADTLRSAVGQTWKNKEVIVVDDGSTDRTLAVAKQFESDAVRVVTQKNQGASAARNKALSLAQGNYIQWLDADDILGADKIARQMSFVDAIGSGKILFSSEFGKFLHQWRRAEFVRSRLWEDLSPTEWLIRKMGENLYMQTATWLVSRELTDATGLWDTNMLSDDDGEYFCRVLLNSEGTYFVDGAKVYYRGFRTNSLAHVGNSDRKRDALWLSMKLHIRYLRSLEDSSRVREACLIYLRRNLINFYPERPDIVGQVQRVAAELGGVLRPPHLSWKYSWIKATLGWRPAKLTAQFMREARWGFESAMDKALSHVRRN